MPLVSGTSRTLGFASASRFSRKACHAAVLLTDAVLTPVAAATASRVIAAGLSFAFLRSHSRTRTSASAKGTPFERPALGFSPSACCPPAGVGGVLGGGMLGVGGAVALFVVAGLGAVAVGAIVLVVVAGVGVGGGAVAGMGGVVALFVVAGLGAVAGMGGVVALVIGTVLVGASPGQTFKPLKASAKI